MRSSSFTTHDVRLIGRYDANSLAIFPDFSSGIMIAFLHICGQFADAIELLKIPSSSSRPLSPNSLRKVGGNVEQE